MTALSATLALREEIGDNILSRILGAWPFMTEDEARIPSLEPAEKAALERLLERARSGDEKAQEALYGMYKARVFGLACRYTYDPVAAEDLLQDIFIKVFTHLGDVRDVATMSAWVYRIALNACYSHLRSKRLRSRTMVPLSAIEGGPGEATYDTHEAELRGAHRGGPPGAPRPAPQRFHASRRGRLQARRDQPDPRLFRGDVEIPALQGPVEDPEKAQRQGRALRENEP